MNNIIVVLLGLTTLSTFGLVVHNIFLVNENMRLRTRLIHDAMRRHPAGKRKEEETL